MSDVSSIFRGSGTPHDWELPDAPPWRTFDGGPLIPAETFAAEPRANDLERAVAYRADAREVELINVAILLRRPLLVTGRPGTGKSTLAHAVAHELRLGPVLRWPITSRTTLQDGLYRYDAIARLQDANLDREERSGIGKYIQLGPLGTALLPTARPRVLLIDEIDKSDVDLPNDLLNVLEEGEFPVPELLRIVDRQEDVQVGVDGSDASVAVRRGLVRCRAFPIVVMTSNGEREFPPAFLRRCVRLEIAEPSSSRLEAIVRAHLGEAAAADGKELIDHFLQQRAVGDLSTDQLLNALFLVLRSAPETPGSRIELAELVIRHLNSTGA